MFTMTANEFKAALKELDAVADVIPDETRIISGTIEAPFSGKHKIHIMDGLDQLVAAVHRTLDIQRNEEYVHKLLDLGAVVLTQVERSGEGDHHEREMKKTAPFPGRQVRADYHR